MRKKQWTKQGDDYEIVLFVGHDEYPIAQDTTGRIECIFRSYDLEDWVGEELVSAIDKRVQDEYGAWIGAIYQMRQSIWIIKVYYTVYCDVVFAGPHGADDDVYDYWPNAVEVAIQWARCIDEINGNKDEMEALKKRYMRHFKDRDLPDEIMVDWDVEMGD